MLQQSRAPNMQQIYRWQTSTFVYLFISSIACRRPSWSWSEASRMIHRLVWRQSSPAIMPDHFIMMPSSSFGSNFVCARMTEPCAVIWCARPAANRVSPAVFINMQKSCTLVLGSLAHSPVLYSYLSGACLSQSPRNNFRGMVCTSAGARLPRSVAASGQPLLRRRRDLAVSAAPLINNGLPGQPTEWQPPSEVNSAGMLYPHTDWLYFFLFFFFSCTLEV